jgi:hypothetical protein
MPETVPVPHARPSVIDVRSDLPRSPGTGGSAARHARDYAAALAAAACRLEELRRDGERLDDLDDTLALWVDVQQAIEAPQSRLTPAVRTNLLRLSTFVVGTICRGGVAFSGDALDSLITINAQIALGLAEGHDPADREVAAA